MLYSQKTTVTRFLFDPRSPNKYDIPEVTTTIPNMKNVKAISYDSYENFLYWVESNPNSKYSAIKRSLLNGTDGETILHSSHNNMMAMDLVVDPYSRLLFWTCNITHSINVTRIIGRPTNIGSVYSSSIDRPHLLAYHPDQK